MGKIVNSCERAFDIMELFAGRQDSLSVTEIHELIGAPYTTCVDIVHTL